MSKLILNTDCGLYEKKGHAFCTSRQIATEFNRQHFHIIRTIEELTASTSGLSESFIKLNFEVSKYKDGSGKWNTEYLLTKDGFTMVVMEFKSAKARKFKQAFIERFNHMESFIKSLETAKLEFPEFTEAIMLAHEEPKHYHFSNEINMINKIVLGMTAKEFREVNNLGDVSSIRPYLTAQQIYAIEKLQKFDIGLNAHEEDFQKRKEILTNYYKKFSAIKLLKNA